MKTVLAEKVSPATLAVFGRAFGWDVKAPTTNCLKAIGRRAGRDADALVVRSAGAGGRCTARSIALKLRVRLAAPALAVDNTG